MPGKEWEQPKNYVELTESQIFEKIKNDLNTMEENFEKNNLKTEFNEIVSLLERLIQKDLANLKLGIQQNKQRRNPERPTEVQEWINLASNNLESLPDNDTNWIANRALKKIHEYLW